MQLPLHTLIVSYPVNLQHETTQYRWIKFNGEGEGLIPILLAQTPGQGTQRLVPRVPGTPETAQSFALLLSFQTLVLLHNVRKQREPALLRQQRVKMLQPPALPPQGCTMPPTKAGCPSGNPLFHTGAPQGSPCGTAPLHSGMQVCSSLVTDLLQEGVQHGTVGVRVQRTL